MSDDLRLRREAFLRNYEAAAPEPPKKKKKVEVAEEQGPVSVEDNVVPTVQVEIVPRAEDGESQGGANRSVQDNVVPNVEDVMPSVVTVPEPDLLQTVPVEKVEDQVVPIAPSAQMQPQVSPLVHVEKSGLGNVQETPHAQIVNPPQGQLVNLNFTVNLTLPVDKNSNNMRDWLQSLFGLAKPQQILQAVPTVVELPDGAGIQPVKGDSLESAGPSSSPATAAPARTFRVNEGAGPSRPRPIQPEESTTVDLTQDDGDDFLQSLRDDSDVSDSDSDDNGIYDDDDYEPPRHVYNTNKSLSLKDHMGLRNYLKTSSQLQGSSSANGQALRDRYFKNAPRGKAGGQPLFKAVASTVRQAQVLEQPQAAAQAQVQAAPAQVDGQAQAPAFMPQPGQVQGQAQASAFEPQPAQGHAQAQVVVLQPAQGQAQAQEVMPQPAQGQAQAEATPAQLVAQPHPQAPQAADPQPPVQGPHGTRCPVCMENGVGARLRCNHVYCIPCLESLKALKRPCPSCRRRFRKWYPLFGAI